MKNEVIFSDYVESCKELIDLLKKLSTTLDSKGGHIYIRAVHWD